MATRYNFLGGLVTDGLIMDLDAAKLSSYPAGGTAWIDISGNGNNGVLTNGPTFSGVGKQAAIVFDGVDDYGLCPKVITTVSFTVSMWINISIINRAESHFLTQDIVGDPGRLLLRVLSSGKIEFFIGGNRFSSSSTVNADTWYHVTCTRGNSGLGSMYINGSIDNSGNLNTNLITDTNTAIAYFPRIPGSSFPGRVATSQIYNRSLSAFEVWQNFNAYKSRYVIPDIVTNGLILNLDAGNPYSYYSPTSGTTWTDVSGNGNNGTLTNGPTYSNGAITFDGVNDYVNTSLQTLDRPCTFSVWVNLSLITGWQTFFGQDTSTAIARGRYYFQKANTNNEGVLQNRVNFQIVLSDNSIVPVNSNNVMSINTWYNYTAVLTTTSISLYENGILQNTVNNSSSFLPANTPITLNSGYYNNALVDFVNGKSSNFLVYNRDLSADEVSQNFNSARRRYGV